MKYPLRSHVTEFLQLQAKALEKLEAMGEEVQDEETLTVLYKIQHRIINLQNLLTRHVYLSGEVVDKED